MWNLEEEPSRKRDKVRANLWCRCACGGQGTIWRSWRPGGEPLETGRKVCTERDQIVQNPGSFWWVRALREIRKDCSIDRKMLQRIALLTVAPRTGSSWRTRVASEDKSIILERNVGMSPWGGGVEKVRSRTSFMSRLWLWKEGVNDTPGNFVWATMTCSSQPRVEQVWVGMGRVGISGVWTVTSSVGDFY